MPIARCRDSPHCGYVGAVGFPEALHFASTLIPKPGGRTSGPCARNSKFAVHSKASAPRQPYLRIFRTSPSTQIRACWPTDATADACGTGIVLKTLPDDNCRKWPMEGMPGRSRLSALVRFQFKARCGLAADGLARPALVRETDPRASRSPTLRKTISARFPSSPCRSGATGETATAATRPVPAALSVIEHEEGAPAKCRQSLRVWPPLDA